MDAVSAEGSCKLAKFDVLSPHAFVDAFLNVRALATRALPLGEMHDACAALEEIIAQTELRETLFVDIPEFDETNPLRYFTDDALCLIDMNALVRVALSKQAYVFSAAADLLAVRVPQFPYSVDGRRFWLATVYKAKWGDEDLVHSGHFLQRNGARYRLVSYVEYVGATHLFRLLSSTPAISLLTSARKMSGTMQLTRWYRLMSRGTRKHAHIFASSSLWCF